MTLRKAETGAVAFVIALIATMALAGAAEAAEALPAAPIASSAEMPEGDLTRRIIQVFLLVTVLSIAPGAAMMITSLPFILIVLSMLRQGVGLQSAPPNMLIISVALFLTWFVMEPVFTDAWSAGVRPYIDNELSQPDAFLRTLEPFRHFMMSRVDPGALEILNDARPGAAETDLETPPLSLLTPAFVLSEVQRAFAIGFVILLPFLVIDLLVASILMSMGMMMVPPAIVSLPFTVAFFVLTNAWVTVSGELVRGYG